MRLQPIETPGRSRLEKRSPRSHDHARPPLMAALPLVWLCTASMAGAALQTADAGPLAMYGGRRAVEGAAGRVAGTLSNAGGVIRHHQVVPDGTAASSSSLAVIFPTSINSAGAVTGVFQDAGNVGHGFVRAEDGTFTTFDAPGAGTPGTLGTEPAAINPAGTVTGEYFDAGDVAHGFLRSSGGTFTTFDAPGGAFTETFPFAINPAGTVTGFYLSRGIVYHGFVRAANGIITTFDPPGAVRTRAVGINPAGAITGSYSDASGVVHGFVRAANGNITTFDAPGSGQIFGVAINPSGAVTGSYLGASGGYHGFVRAADGTITTVDLPGASSSIPLAINPAGTVTGSFVDPSGVSHGFLRTASGTITPFDAPGAATGEGQGTYATAINPAGTVTGSFSDASGVSHGLLRAADGAITTFDAPEVFSSADAGRTAGGSASPSAAGRSNNTPAAAAEVGMTLVTRVGGTSVLEYSLPVASDVSLAVYDVAGRRVAMLEQGSRSAGVHQVRWDGKGVASGVYFYRLHAGAVTVTKSAIILR
jgi:flagellar hook capping protein FlgD